MANRNYMLTPQACRDTDENRQLLSKFVGLIHDKKGKYLHFNMFILDINSYAYSTNNLASNRIFFSQKEMAELTLMPDLITAKLYIKELIDERLSHG